jgi:hypothetical protein
MITYSHNTLANEKTKHIKWHFLIKDHIELGTIMLAAVTQRTVADVFIKPLPILTLSRHRRAVMGAHPMLRATPYLSSRGVL